MTRAGQDVERVRAYLVHTGGAEIDGPSGMYLGLGRRVTRSGIRAALKALGAVARKHGDWPKWASNGQRIPAFIGNEHYCATKMPVARSERRGGKPNSYAAFTVYRLAARDGGAK